MAATYHTTHLGLSLWAQTDCPQWADFLQDNQKLDQQVGGHIQDSALHLTAEEKQYLSQRSASVTYTGTGSGTQSVTLPFCLLYTSISGARCSPVLTRCCACKNWTCSCLLYTSEHAEARYDIVALQDTSFPENLPKPGRNTCH